MSVTPLRPIHRFLPGIAAPNPVELPRPTVQTLVAKLMQDRVVQPHVMLQVLAQHTHHRRHLADMLLARCAVPPDALYDCIAQHWDVGRVDLMALPPDPRYKPWRLG